jgi:ATP-binding cassette subfamily F protein uup
MLTQRGERPAVGAETRKTSAKPPVERPSRTSAPKMNFADAHALKILPEKIAAAELKMAALEKELSDSGLYARDQGKFARLSEELAGIRTQKDADEERWLVLEMEREALESRN